MSGSWCVWSVLVGWVGWCVGGWSVAIAERFARRRRRWRIAQSFARLALGDIPSTAQPKRRGTEGRMIPAPRPTTTEEKRAERQRLLFGVEPDVATNCAHGKHDPHVHLNILNSTQQIGHSMLQMVQKLCLVSLPCVLIVF